MSGAGFRIFTPAHGTSETIKPNLRLSI